MNPHPPLSPHASSRLEFSTDTLPRLPSVSLRARTLYPFGHFASREGYVFSRRSADRRLKRVFAVARKFPKIRFAY